MALGAKKPQLGAGLLACLLAISASHAQAAVFHVLDMGEAAEGSYANIMPEGEVQAEAGGAKSAAIDKVTLDFAHGGQATLDQTRILFDCSAKRFKVLSERLYQGLDANAPAADKPSPAGWQTFAAGSPMDAFQAFACRGPSAVRQEVAAFDRPSVWDAAGSVAGALTKIHNDEAGGTPPSPDK